jgi:RuvB-like protein 1 (pontin 52)
MSSHFLGFAEFESDFAHRYALQLLTPASISATLAGRSQIELEDIGEMNELFLDAKTSAAMIGAGGGFDGGRL